MHGDDKLMQVVQTTCLTGSFTCLLNGGHQKRDQHGNDCHHDQKFDKCKSSAGNRWFRVATQHKALQMIRALTLGKKSCDCSFPTGNRLFYPIPVRTGMQFPLYSTRRVFHDLRFSVTVDDRTVYESLFRSTQSVLTGHSDRAFRWQNASNAWRDQVSMRRFFLTLVVPKWHR